MTVSTLHRTVSSTANGTNRTFYFDFAILEEDHLDVFTISSSGTETEETEYLLDEGWGDSGGSITFNLDEQPANGVTVLMERNIPVAQETDYLPGDPFPAETHEDALDKLTMLIQSAVSETSIANGVNFDRCITVPRGDTATNLECPWATQRANKYLYFDADGNVTVEDSTVVGDNYYTMTEIDANYYTMTEIDANYYTMTEIDANYYTMTDIDALLDYSAWVDTLLGSANGTEGRTNIGYYSNTGRFTKSQSFTTATLTDAGTISWDADSGQVAKVTITDDRAMGNPTNMQNGGTYVLTVIQDGTGSRALTWGSAYKFEDDTDPSLSDGADEKTIIFFWSDGTYMYGGIFWKEVT